MSNQEIAATEHARFTNDVTERMEHAVSFAQGALRSLYLANAGALIALLTFVGNTQKSFEDRALFWAFVWFGIGLFAALICSVVAALSQLFYMQSAVIDADEAFEARSRGVPPLIKLNKFDRYGDASIYLLIALAFGSVLLFVVGAFVALDAIT